MTNETTSSSLGENRVNHALRFILGSYDLPVTHMYDIDGDETLVPEEAFSIVAGPLPDGKWLATEVRLGDIVENKVGSL